NSASANIARWARDILSLLCTERARFNFIKEPLLMVRLAATKTGDLPAGCLFHVAQLLAAEGTDQVERHISDLAGRAHHLDEGGKDGIERRIVGKHPHEMKSELVDHLGLALCGSAHFYAVVDGKNPVGFIGLGGSRKLVRCLVVEGGLGWRAEHTIALLRVG